MQMGVVADEIFGMLRVIKPEAGEEPSGSSTDKMRRTMTNYNQFRHERESTPSLEK